MIGESQSFKQHANVFFNAYSWLRGFVLVLFLLLHRQKYAGPGFESVYLTLMKFFVVSARDRTRTEQGGLLLVHFDFACFCAAQIFCFSAKATRAVKPASVSSLRNNVPHLNWFMCDVSIMSVCLFLHC